MNPVIGFLIGTGVGVGLLVIYLGTRPAPQRIRRQRSTGTRPEWMTLYSPREKALAVLGLAAGVLLWLLQGWALAAILLPAIAVGLPRLLDVPGQDQPEELEALEEWVRSLRAVLCANLPLATAIIQTVDSCPERIRPQVERLVERINARTNLTDALYRFADDLDSQTGDFVASSLIEASKIGSSGLGSALASIAAEVSDEVRMRRDIGIIHAKAISQARWLTLIFTGMLTVIVVALPLGSFYHSGIGQFVLAAVAILFGLCLIWVRQVVTPTPPARFLIRPQELT